MLGRGKKYIYICMCKYVNDVRTWQNSLNGVQLLASEIGIAKVPAQELDQSFLAIKMLLSASRWALQWQRRLLHLPISSTPLRLWSHLVCHNIAPLLGNSLAFQPHRNKALLKTSAPIRFLGALLGSLDDTTSFLVRWTGCLLFSILTLEF